MVENRLFQNGRSQNLYFYTLAPPAIESDPFLLLIEEVIDYSLRHHNIHDWIPPVNLQFLRSKCPTIYFNERFGNLVIDHEVEKAAISLARRNGFSEENWLKLEDREEARNFHYFYLCGVYHPDQPMLHKMFSFACYESRLAMNWNRNSLVNDVVWALVYMFRQIISYGEYYQACHAVDYINNVEDPDADPENIDEGVVEEEIYDEYAFVKSDLLILFVEEIIYYSLNFSNLHGWIPLMNMQVLRYTNQQRCPNIDENLGRAVTHPFTEKAAVLSALAHGFDEKIWLELCNPSEARHFQYYYLSCIFCSTNSDLFQTLSFACYASKVAMRGNRHSLVNAVVWALVYLFSSYFPFLHFYKQLKTAAEAYVRLLPQDEDEGIDE